MAERHGVRGALGHFRALGPCLSPSLSPPRPTQPLPRLNRTGFPFATFGLASAWHKLERGSREELARHSAVGLARAARGRGMGRPLYINCAHSG